MNAKEGVRPSEFHSPRNVFDNRKHLDAIAEKILSNIEAQRSGFKEYLQLRELDSFYRGTRTGIGYLEALFKLAHLVDGEDATPPRNAQIDLHRPIYDDIAAKLLKFDRLTAIEAAADGRANPTDVLARLARGAALSPPAEGLQITAAMIDKARGQRRVSRAEFIASLRQTLEETNRSNEGFPVDKALQVPVLAAGTGAAEIKR